MDISTTFRSCDCTLSTNASVLVVQTYSNRLYVNQTLALTHKNGTVIKQWKKPGNLDEMLGNDTIAVSNSELRLKWHNKASENGGKIWIVMEGRSITTFIVIMLCILLTLLKRLAIINLIFVMYFSVLQFLMMPNI